MVFGPFCLELTAKWGEPDIEMFASILNYKVSQHVAWKPDLGAIAIDAFTQDWSRYKLNILLSSFQSHRQCFTIHPRKQYNSNIGDPLLANPVLVPTSPAVAEISTIGNQDAKINPHTSIPTRGSSPIVPQTSTSWLSCVRASLVAQGVEGEPLNIILDSWRTGTQK